MNYKKIAVGFTVLGMTMICFSGCGLAGDDTSALTVTPSPTVAISSTPKATVTPTPKSEQVTGQSSSGSQSGSSQKIEDQDDNSASESVRQSETAHEIQYISGNVRDFGDGTITVEVGNPGNYYNMVFVINNAELDIDNGSNVKTSLNVDLEYYVDDGVNIVTVLHSDGEEYMSPSFIEEQESMHGSDSEEDVGEAYQDSGDASYLEDVNTDMEY